MKRKSSFVIFILLFILLAVGEVVYFVTGDENVSQETGFKMAGVLEYADNYVLNPEDNIVQKFRFQDQELHKLLIYFQKLDADVTGNLNILVKDQNNKLVNQWSPAIESMEEDLFYIVFFYEDDVFETNTDYYVEISIENNDQSDCALKLVPCTSRNRWLMPVIVNNEQLNGFAAYMEMETTYNNYEVLRDKVRTCIILNCGIGIFFLLGFYGVKLIRKLQNKLSHSELLHRERSNLCARCCVYAFVLLLFLVGGAYYSIQDLIFLIILFASSYVVGFYFLNRFNISNVYASIGVGLCVIGVIVCYLLAFGLGNRVVYLLILILPIILGRNELKNITQKACDAFSKQTVFYMALGIIFLFYLALGSRPISASDAIVKHLPISIYAAELGAWYDNILENIVAYSESTMLHYSYTTMMVAFNCYKALTLFNVFIFFIVFLSSLKFARTIYKDTNKWLLLTVYFSIPYIMQITTSFTVDIFPILIVFTAIALIQTLEVSDILKKIPVLAFLTGCAIYTKLTILSSMLAVCIVIAGILVVYIYRQGKLRKTKTAIWEIVKKIPISLLLFCLPFIYSFYHNWYMTGNPFSITAYNEVFKSPYFNQQSFDRPFENNAIGASLKCFWEITFKTSNTVEAANGAMGYIWILIVLVPVGIILLRNSKLLVWFLDSLLGLQIAGIIVGNLRYIIALLLVIQTLIVISISAIIEKVKVGKYRIGLYIITVMLFLLPNIFFLSEEVKWNRELKPDCRVTLCGNVEVLQWLPQNARVISFNDGNKGDFRGFFFYPSWHNEYVVNKLESGEISFNDFVGSFDYAILNKTKQINDETDAFLLNLCNQALRDGLLVEKVQSEQYVLYEINADKQSEIYDQAENVVLQPYENICHIISDVRALQIVVEADGVKTSQPCATELKVPEVIVEIAYRDKNENLISYDRKGVKLYPWLQKIDTGFLVSPKNAETVTIKIINENTEVLNIESYKIQVKKYNSVLDNLIDEYYQRIEFQHEK